MGPDQGSGERSKAWSSVLRSARRIQRRLAITITDDESDPNELRFVTLGVGIKRRVLVVVYCFRGETLRIISPRTAGRLELEKYETQP